MSTNQSSDQNPAFSRSPMGGKKSAVISIRVTDEMKMDMERQAHLCGMSASEWAEKKPECWPGTDIVKSTNNGFTAKPRELSPADKGRLTSQRNAAKGHATQKKLGKGFGHATMGGLSKRAEAQLKNVPKSIRIKKKVTDAEVSHHRKLVRTAI